MAKTITPDYNYAIAERPGELELTVKTLSTTRVGLAALMSGVFGAFGFLFVIIGVVTGTFWALLIGAGLLVGAWYTHKLGNSKKTNKILIDKESITCSGKRYLLDHVTSIGYDTIANQPTFVAPGRAAAIGAAAAMAAKQAAGYYIYITYGTDRVRIITGLSGDNVDEVYRKVTDFLRAFGRDYT
ncbi:MAG: hypothetical protein OEL76_07465 [Siculibacillus sp.]|nr:hypothetical protein [Siculibacillus sp.]